MNAQSHVHVPDTVSPQAQWLAEIRKMRAPCGAPIPVDQEQALARNLARINGSATGN